MAWGLLVVGTIAVVECFIALPLLNRAKFLTKLLNKITWVLRSSSVSDHWKERVLPVYAGKLFSSSILLFFWVMIGVLPMIVLVVIAELLELPMLSLVSSMYGLIGSTVVAIVYVYLRQRVFHG